MPRLRSISLPVIGVLAELTGLRAALLLVCGACLVAGALATRIGADSTSPS